MTQKEKDRQESRFIRKISERYLFSPFKSEISILDYGCGNGRMLDYLEDKTFPLLKKHFIKYDYSGIDIDVDRLICCAKKYHYHTFHTVKGFEFKEYDLIICCHVLEHNSRKKAIKLIKKMVNYLKPNGLLLIGLPVLGENYFDDYDHINYMTPNTIENISKYLLDGRLKLIYKKYRRYGFPYYYENGIINYLMRKFIVPVLRLFVRKRTAVLSLFQYK